MADQWLEVAKQIPSLGVLVWLVFQFLGHLKSEGDLNRSTREKEVTAMMELAKAVSQLQAKIG